MTSASAASSAVALGPPGNALPLSPYSPFDPVVDDYVYSRTNLGIGTVTPLEYAGWREEAMSWQETCYLHTGLNPAVTYRVTGPDALRFISDLCVNGVSTWRIGMLKHGIMCNEDGLVLLHGVLMRAGQDEYLLHYRSPYPEYKLTTGRYDAVGEYIRDEFIFQLGGPRSLEIIETATRDCLHDIRFSGHRPSEIDGMPVRILRMGMAGTLSYEVHGKTRDAIAIYDSLMAAGQPHGILKLGRIGYTMNHTQNGFPQAFVDFPGALGEDEGFKQYLGAQSARLPAPVLTGSMGDDIRLRYRNPVELGWKNMIKFDHDFIGRRALEQEAASPRRTMVTLVWNPEDILDVHRSQFQPGEHYLPMDHPMHFTQAHARHVMHADQVLKDAKLTGISTGRMYSYRYRAMISLCSIDTENSELGTQVTVLWGNPGTRQKEIRATVSRFPFMNENRNENIDVITIPCRAGSKQALA